MVRKVKRAESYKVEHPYTTSADTTFEDLQELMAEKGVHSILGKPKPKPKRQVHTIL